MKIRNLQPNIYYFPINDNVNKRSVVMSFRSLSNKFTGTDVTALLRIVAHRRGLIED